MDYLQDFLDYLLYVRGRSVNTIHSYRFTLKEYLSWLQTRNLDPKDVKPMDIDSYFIHLRKDKNNTASTVSQKYYCLKSMYRWFLRNDWIQRDPLTYSDKGVKKEGLPKYLTPSEQEKLIKAAQEGMHRKRIWFYSKQRSYVLILLLLEAGLRIAEACSLKWEDVNFEEGILKVRGKGDKERIAVLSNQLLAALKEYFNRVNVIDLETKVRAGIQARGLNLRKVAEETGISFLTVSDIVVARRPKSIKGNREKELQAFIEKVKKLPLQYILFNKGGTSLNTRQAFRLVREIGRKAGIEIYPHLLRHSFAVNLRRKGGDIMLLKEALGHSSVSTTQIYAAFTEGEFKERMRQLIN